MSFFRPTIEDATGRHVPLVRYEMLPRAMDDERRARLERIKPVGLEKSKIVASALLLLPVVAVVGLLPATLVYWLKLPPAMTIVVSMFSGLIVPFSVIFVMRRTTAPQLRDGLLEAELCPSCGYDLQTLARDADGQCLCPECGSTWRMPARP